MNINWKKNTQAMGNANSGKKGDQVENGKKKNKKKNNLYINSYLISWDS
jgi:hypothetical protein